MIVLPANADVFCGFYVAGAEGEIYQGPPQDFAIVIPVPVVLRESDVKVLPDAIFERVDELTAPRLAEYWEQDPCDIDEDSDDSDGVTVIAPQPFLNTYLDSRWIGDEHGVTVEAEYEVGEYEVVILSAEESTGLDAWLRQNDYAIPAGTQPLLEPYVHSGSKFFVAKVDVDEVELDADGRAMLSPLRFHYDSPEFSLPVRLGLINSRGLQDLLIHILAHEVRYELVNYDNVAIPTNLDVEDRVRGRFGQFYASLFDHTVAQHPGAV